jgi:alkylated DNA repair dioxygenase AlkB
MLNLLPHDGEMFYYPAFLESKTANSYKQQILTEVTWREDKISFFGKTFNQPRQVAWHGEAGIVYQYSKISMSASGWTPTLVKIKLMLEQFTKQQFNSVLVNHYRNGQDYMSWHQDNEKELGENPIIASITLGESRDFLYRNLKNKQTYSLMLENGSLLLMQGSMQSHWQHALPKRLKVNADRLNLTYRFVYS